MIVKENEQCYRQTILARLDIGVKKEEKLISFIHSKNKKKRKKEKEKADIVAYLRYCFLSNRKGILQSTPLTRINPDVFTPPLPFKKRKDLGVRCSRL